MREMIRIGAYRRGANAEVDQAIDFHARFESFLAQPREDAVGAAAAERMLIEILAAAEARDS